MVGEIMFSKKFKKIGLKIAYYRKRKALKQMEVAEKAAGISCSYLSKIETGKVRYSLAVLIQIAKVLDIDPGELLTDGSSY